MDTVTLTLAKNYTDQRIKGAGAPVSGVSSINNMTGDVKLTAEDVGAVSTEGGRISGGLFIFGGEYGSIYIDDNGQIQLRSPDDENCVNIAMSISNNKRELHFFGENDETVELRNIASPSTNLSAANKKYVDDAISTAINNLGFVEQEAY